MINKKIIIILGILVLLVGGLFILKGSEGISYSELLSNNLVGIISAVGEVQTSTGILEGFGIAGIEISEIKIESSSHGEIKIEPDKVEVVGSTELDFNKINIFESKKNLNHDSIKHLINLSYLSKVGFTGNLTFTQTILIDYNKVRWNGTEYLLTTTPVIFESWNDTETGNLVVPNIFMDDVLNKRINYKDIAEKGGYATAYENKGRYFVELKIDNISALSLEDFFVDPTYFNQTDGFNLGDAGANNPAGMTTNGTDFWVIDEADRFIYHFNSTGDNQTDGFPFTIPSDLDGITTNGTGKDFWLLSFTDNFVYHVNSTGQNQGDGFSYASIGINAQQLAGNGTDFYFIPNIPENLVHVDGSGNLIETFGNFGNDPTGIGFNGTDLWILDKTLDFVTHLNSTGDNQTDGFQIASFGITKGKGMTAFGESDLWIVDSIDDFVYHLSTSQPLPVVNLDNPTDNTFTNVLNQSFNASYSATEGDLVNSTLNIWNSTDLVFNETESVTGTSNTSNISFVFTVDDEYFWNYEVCNDSVLCGFSLTNFTITIDTIAPTFDNLANISVDANTSFSFDINATDATSPISCFTVNDTVNFQIDCSGVLQNNTVLFVQVYPLNISVNDSANNTAFGTMNVNVTVFDTILKWDWAALMTDLVSPDQICFLFRDSEEYCIDRNTITGRWNVSGTNLFPSDLNNNVGIGTSSPAEPLHIIADSGGEVIRLEENTGGQFFNIGVDSSGNLEFINDSDTVFRLINSLGTAEHVDGTKNNPAITFISDINSGMFSAANNILGFSAGTVEFLRFVESVITTDEAVFNEDGLVIDFRIESNIDTHAFFLQGSDGFIGIGTTSPDKLLEVEGTAAAILIDSSTNANLIIDRAGANRQGNIDFKTGNILKWSIGSPDSDNGGDGSEFFIGTSPLGGSGAKFWIETNGNVGIGTTSPDAHLEVSGTGIQKIIINSTDGSEVQFDLTSDTKLMRLFFRESDGDFGIWNGTLTRFRLDGDGHFEFNGGNVGIGVTDPVTKLEVVTRSNTPLRVYRKTTDTIQNLLTLHSDVTSTENLKWRVEADGDTISDTGSYTSDERIKININPITNALDIIMQLKPVSHEYIEGWTKPGIRYSFIAQDVEKVLPELVRDDGLDAPQFLKDQGILTVKALRYNDFIAINTKAIQELKAENDLLKEDLCSLGIARWCLT